MSPRKTLVLGSAILACIVFAGWFTDRPTWLDSTGGDGTGVLTGSVAPDFTLKALSGQEVKLSGYRGQKTVVVSFWATWCGPCRLEMPSIEAFYRHNRAKDVEVLAVSIDENPGAARKYAAENRLPFPVLVDQNSETASRYHVGGIPSLFVIDRAGKVRAFHQGLNPSLEAELAADLNASNADPAD
jgi:peroxiredoxin